MSNDMKEFLIYMIVGTTLGFVVFQFTSCDKQRREIREEALSKCVKNGGHPLVCTQSVQESIR